MIAPRFVFGAVWASVCIVLAAPTLSAQIPTVIQGRVEDMDSREPIAGARVFSADSTAVAMTDSAGAFVIQLPPSDSVALHVERIGYLSQRFDLPQESLSRVSVLLLEPAAVQLPGVTVIATPAIEVLQQNLERRRNFFPGPMRAYDRTWLDRFAPIGSVFALVRQRFPGIFRCQSDPWEMCIRGRSPTLTNPYPTSALTVCIDGRKAIDSIAELESISIEDWPWWSSTAGGE